MLSWPLQRAQCFSSCLGAEDGYPTRFPAGIPVTAEKCRLSGDGVRVLPLGHPKVGTSQTSGFVFRRLFQRCEQRASREPPEYVPRSGWQRPFGGHSQCLPSRLRLASEGGGVCRGRGAACSGSLIPSPPTLHLPAHRTHPLWKAPSALPLQSCPGQSPSPSPH